MYTLHPHLSVESLVLLIHLWSSTSTSVGTSHEGLRHRPQGGELFGVPSVPLSLECKLDSNPSSCGGSFRESPPPTSAPHSLAICLCLCPGKTRRNPCCRPAPSGSVSNAINSWDGLCRHVKGPGSPPGVNNSMCSVYVWSPLLFVFACAPSPPLCPLRVAPGLDNSMF